ncbi:MAG: DUF2079 domain-containing protein [Candidatus Eremiobacteraeota bacterium]|nr:DUF2079 domain-containing protein [Candidatus Eremiobacteraeota bacterium]
MQAPSRAPALSDALAQMPYVWLGVGVFIAVYIAVDLNKLYALRYGMDVGIFLQSLVNFTHTGSTFNWVERQPHLTVHDSWLLLGLAPLVRLFPRPETLLVVQVVAVAIAAVPLYIFARGCGLAAPPAQLVTLAYLISPSAQGWAYMDFSENVFVPLLAFSLAIAVQRRSLYATLLFAQLLMGVKEDEIWFIAWFSLAGALWYDRRLGLATLALALVNGAGYYVAVHAAGYAPAKPQYLWWPSTLPQDLAFLAEVLAPFAFAPLALGWRVLLATPMVVEITFPAAWAYPLARAGTHWTVPLVTLIAIGAAIAIARYPRWASWAFGCAIVMALFFNVTVVHIGRHLYPPDTAGYAQARAVALSGRPAVYTPDDEGAFVIASPDLQAQLINRSAPRKNPKPAWITH